MKSSDYNSAQKADTYHQKRFSGGLSQVHLDEKYYLEKYLTKHQPHPKIFLDLGTGTGRIIKILLNHHPQTIYALDQSKAMLSHTKNQFPTQIKKGTIKPILSQAHHTTLPKESVDSATAFHLFKHLKHPKPTLQEIARVLKPGGLLIFDSLNQNSLIRFNLGSCHATSQKRLADLLLQENFKIIKITPLHTFGETIYKPNFPPFLKLIHLLDKISSHFPIPVATKFLVIAQKNE